MVQKKNSQQLAKLLKINRTRIHYHLNILEEFNFIEVVDTDSINGIIQKYYLPTTHTFIPAPNIFNDFFNNISLNFNIDKENEEKFWYELKQLENKFFSKKDTDIINKPSKKKIIVRLYFDVKLNFIVKL
ncbi:ArsR/SmtB family transcription factor [Gemella massiliensis]|uniref:ArsR/SmtB family transcription factor n=1 Tax=Gemella massiliensis TaxID=1909670 RepID=UPI000ABA920F|nr:helix-turn-helix domain-containing protein [Gemella massiliensis]